MGRGGRRRGGALSQPDADRLHSGKRGAVSSRGGGQLAWGGCRVAPSVVAGREHARRLPDVRDGLRTRGARSAPHPGPALSRAPCPTRSAHGPSMPPLASPVIVLHLAAVVTAPGGDRVPAGHVPIEILDDGLALCTEVDDPVLQCHPPAVTG
jgi:hypothetical protein